MTIENFSTVMSSLRKYITKKPASFTAECSVKLSPNCLDEDELEARTITAAEREMLTSGWLDDFIVEDTINIACPWCVEYCKERVEDFEEIDVRAGGKAK
jgi:hypothetical protein